MSTIPLDYEDQPTGRVLKFRPDPFAPPPRVSTPELMRQRIRESAAHAKAIVAGIARRRDLSNVEPCAPPTTTQAENVQERAVSEAGRVGCWTEPRTPVVTVSTDVQGSPSESRCARSQLDNILAVRDEREARKARGTVKPR